MDPDLKVRYDVIIGTPEDIKKQLNDPIWAHWRPTLMSTYSTYQLLAVLLQKCKKGEHASLPDFATKRRELAELARAADEEKEVP